MNSHDIIDKYIKGQLSEMEIATFEQEMREDSELAQQVELRQEIAQAIYQKGLKDLLKKTEAGIKAKALRNKIFKIYLPSLAVAASLIVGCFIYISTSRCSTLGYSIELTQAQLRGGNDKILTHIESKEFEAALALIEEFRTAQYQFDTSTEEGRYEALQYTQTKEDLEWYEAVVYMRMGKFRKARHCLQEIVKNNGYYSDEAGKLSNEL